MKWILIKWIFPFQLPLFIFFLFFFLKAFPVLLSFFLDFFPFSSFFFLCRKQRIRCSLCIFLSILFFYILLLLFLCWCALCFCACFLFSLPLSIYRVKYIDVSMERKSVFSVVSTISTVSNSSTDLPTCAYMYVYKHTHIRL